jgi:phosphoribosylaminoimidazolecarboxamide formyltransferase / IMP cyclohydrolase
VSKRALLSVSDKSGLAAFARGLQRLDYELYSTGGTLQALDEAAVEAKPITELTGFPEIMDGRVKTLHPAVHAGLLAVRENSEHMRTLAEHGLRTIDLLCVNLYPFAATAARKDAGFEDVVEQIDVGGPAMVRAAAKNHRGVIVIVRPERYTEVLTALQKDEVTPEFRRRLAAEAFAHTAVYDSQIAAWLRASEEEMPSELSVAGMLVQPLRYGENPHQRAAFYRLAAEPGGLAAARQLQGGELSFNNIQDAAAAAALVEEYERPAAAIIKHTNPCGLALGADLAEAYRKAYECDPTSAYGGVVAVNRPLDSATAEQIASIFVEVVVAPAVEPEALEALAHKEKVRLLEARPVRAGAAGYDLRGIPGGFLAQTWDRDGFDRSTCVVATKRTPTEEEWEQLEFAWLAVKHVKSNAIVLARDLTAVGVGAGQMSRVEAAQIAVKRAGDRCSGSVMASDAFFPFPDGVEEGLRAGVTAVIQPGGSMRDASVVAAVEEAGGAMVLTGRRHFRH